MVFQTRRKSRFPRGVTQQDLRTADNIHYTVWAVLFHEVAVQNYVSSRVLSKKNAPGRPSGVVNLTGDILIFGDS